MEKIGIVLLNYNDFESVFDFIRFVEPYSNIIELALVDNNSTDGSYEKFLEFNKKWIHVIKAQSNNGYASGNNLGLRYLALNFPNIKVLCISNPDVIHPGEQFKIYTNGGGSSSNTTYTVKSGDTLSSIAAKIGTTWQKIYNDNRDKIPNPDIIYPGQQLVIK